MQRSDLFGLYGTSTHQPQGRVLTAEEMYGALDNPAYDPGEEEGYGAIFAEEEDDFEEEEMGALMSDSLLDEEDYVDDIDEDDEPKFGALFSQSLLAEEEYGAHDFDDFGEDDEDDEDPELDADLDAALAELRSEPELMGYYGYGYAGGAPVAGAVALEAGFDQLREVGGPSKGQMKELARALNMGVVLPKALQGGYIESAFESMQRLGAGDDDFELAHYIILQPDLDKWDARGPGIVRNAVIEAMIPGREFQVDDEILNGWKQIANDLRFKEGLKNKIQTAFMSWKDMGKKALKGAGVDLSGIFWDAVEAVKGLHPGNRFVGWLADYTPSADEPLNQLAISYYMMSLAQDVMPPTLTGGPGAIWQWLAESVEAHAADVIDAAIAARQAADAAVVTEEEVIFEAPRVAPRPEPPVVVEPTTITEPTYGLPAPPTILAVGYSVMCAGALLGVFKS
jgi:hypothetical protein